MSFDVPPEFGGFLFLWPLFSWLERTHTIRNLPQAVTNANFKLTNYRARAFAAKAATLTNAHTS